MEKLIDRIHHWLARHSFVRTALIFILVLLCAFELDAILRGLRGASIDRTDMSLQYRHGQVIRQSDTAVPSDIEPWMTFQYINFIFKLPPSYLKDVLDIGDAQYPNIQLARYARMHDLPLDAYVTMVQQTVSDYTPGSF